MVYIYSAPGSFHISLPIAAPGCAPGNGSCRNLPRMMTSLKRELLLFLYYSMVIAPEEKKIALQACHHDGLDIIGHRVGAR